jgi:tetratricopeptide (TPR) repeat protein
MTHILRSQTALLSLRAAAVLLLAVTAFPVLAETLKDWKCTGNSDIPWDEQIAGCTDALKSGHFAGPAMAVAHYDRALAYQNKGNHDNAIADYTQAIATDPKLAAAHNNRGNVYQAKGDYDRAMADFDQAIALDPKFSSSTSTAATCATRRAITTAR